MTTCKVMESKSHWLPMRGALCSLHALAQRHGVPESAVTVAMLRADVGQLEMGI